MLLDRESQDSDSSSEDSGDEDMDFSVGQEQPESSSHEESSDDESEGEMETEDAASGWNSKNGKIIWSPTNLETLNYVLAPTNITAGPTHYAAARIRDPASSFSLFLTEEIVQLTVDMDCDELRAYVGLLILSGVYRSRDESSLSLWGEKYGRDIFSRQCPTSASTKSAGRSDSTISCPGPDAVRTSWPRSAKCGICGFIVWSCFSTQTETFALMSSWCRTEDGAVSSNISQASLQSTV